MLELLRKEVIGEILNAHIGTIFDTYADPSAMFVRRKTYFAIMDQNDEIAKASKKELVEATGAHSDGIEAPPSRPDSKS